MPEVDAEAPAITPAVAAPPEVQATPPAAPDAAPADKDWSKTVVIVGNHRFPGDKRPIIVVEQRDVELDKDTGDFVGVTVKKDGYPAKADVYFRTDPEVVFPEGETLTLGYNVLQGMFHGFSPDARFLHVGPASPVYAACNIAYQRGAKEIEIIGLSDGEKQKLQPWFDGLAKGGPDPIPGATDVRTPAQVKITLS